MIQRCIFNFALIAFLSWACKYDEEKNVEYLKFELDLETSIKLGENFGFFQKADKIDLVSDSVIIAFSSLSGLAIYNLFNGEQIDFIDPRSSPKRTLFFSSFDSNNFPDIYLLEPRQNKVFVYNYYEKEIVKEIPLNLELGTSIRVFGGKFISYQDTFYIELNPVGTPMLDPDYYKNSGKFIGVFDSEGNLTRRIVDYPEQLTNPMGYFVPANYYSFDFYNDEMFICFPFEKFIRVYELNAGFEKYESIPLPKLDYMTLDLINIPEKFNPRLIPVETRQISARVSNLLVDDGKLYLSFAINDNEKTDRYREFISVFQLDLNEMKWEVQDKLVDIYDLGEFAGVSFEKLVFFDSFLKTKDEKFVNLVRME
jgi:hypothetical protein